MTGDLVFVKNHNVGGYLNEPSSEDHRDMKSMITALSSCKLTYALKSSPSIFKNLIQDFWKNASLIKRGGCEPDFIESTVRGTKVIVSECVIRKALKFEDKSVSCTEFPAFKVKAILDLMHYEGEYPSTLKRMLPPFWRYLFHTFAHCISGRATSDEIPQNTTSAVVAFVMDWDYNFSKYVFDEMISNLGGKKKKPFLMYPRFLQMIFNEEYPMIERSGDILDIKPLGPNTFTSMKTPSSASLRYKELKPFVKFGRFVDTVKPLHSSEIALQMIPPALAIDSKTAKARDPTECDVTTTKSPVTKSPSDTFVPETPAGQVKTEIGSPIPKSNSQRLMCIEETIEISDDEDDELELNAPIHTEQEMMALIDDYVALASPDDLIPQSVNLSDVPIPMNVDDDNIQEDSEVPLVARKRKRHVISTEEADSGDTESIPVYSANSGNTEPVDDDSVSSRATEPFDAESPAPVHSFSMPAYSNFGSGEHIISESDKSELQLLKGRIFALETENNEQKKTILTLQQNLDDQKGILMDLQQRLLKQFGSTFANLGTPSSKSPFNKESTAAAETHINQYISTRDLSFEERLLKRKSLDEKKKRRPTVVLMKNSNQNVQSPNHPDIFIKPMAEIEGDVYGDRSGIYVWGFDKEIDLWFVKRKSLNVEYYKSIADFSSWTKTDLAELVEAPYHDPTLNPKGWNFKRFLENQKRVGFTGMKTQKSFLKKSLSQVDPVTKRPIYHVKWPKTEQVRQIPVKKALPDGTLDTLEHWAFDEATTTVLIKTEHKNIRLVDIKDLFMFRERDIKKLAATEMLNDKSLFVPAAKQFVNRAKVIVDQETWADKLEQSAMHVLFEDA